MALPGRVSGDLVLGFDYGTRRIGVALGHRQLGSARPLGVVTNRNPPDWASLDGFVTPWQPHVLVVGLPPLASSISSRRVHHGIRRFAAALQQRYHLSVILVDEHLSSWAVRQELRQLGTVRHHVDAGAAACIVETYLHQQA